MTRTLTSLALASIVPIFALLAALLSAKSAHAQSFDVSAFNSLNYIVNGQDDPALTLTRGTTYTFHVNAPGHPFYIKTQPGSGTLNQFTNGVSGNGVEIGTLTFSVPLNAPNQLFYQCSVHSAMSGSLNIVGGAAVPASGGANSALLCGALLALGALGLRMRRRSEAPQRLGA